MKFAFVHPMRTGGTYAGELFVAATGLAMHCNWRSGRGRDFLRNELLTLAATESEGMLHNHAVNWDAETHRWCREHGWRSFAILRDPCDQLISLWHYCGGAEGTESTLDQFLFDQACGRINANIDFHHWSLPDWWPLIDVLVPYGNRLHEELCLRLGLPNCDPLPRRNACERYCSPSSESLDAVRRSRFYAAYLDAVEKAA